MTDEPKFDATASCRLFLRGDHWVPLGVDTELTEAHRSTPDGPVVIAYLLAAVKNDEIVGWAESEGFTVRNVSPDGSIEPLDLAELAAVLDATRETKRQRPLVLSASIRN